jgi:hypothetical protein
MDTRQTGKARPPATIALFEYIAKFGPFDATILIKLKRAKTYRVFASERFWGGGDARRWLKSFGDMPVITIYTDRTTHEQESDE